MEKNPPRGPESVAHVTDNSAHARNPLVKSDLRWCLKPFSALLIHDRETFLRASNPVHRYRRIVTFVANPTPLITAAWGKNPLPGEEHFPMPAIVAFSASRSSHARNIAPQFNDQQALIECDRDLVLGRLRSESFDL